jgi:hypothetical protein
MKIRSLLGINRWIRIKPDGTFPPGGPSGTAPTGGIAVKLASPRGSTCGPKHGRPRPTRGTPDTAVSSRTSVVAARASSRHLERFHLEWKRSSRCFASNFVSLRSLRDSSQADIALAGVLARATWTQANERPRS